MSQKEDEINVPQLQSPRCKDILPSGMQNKSSGDSEDRCGKHIDRMSRWRRPSSRIRRWGYAVWLKPVLDKGRCHFPTHRSEPLQTTWVSAKCEFQSKPLKRQFTAIKSHKGYMTRGILKWFTGRWLNDFFFSFQKVKLGIFLKFPQPSKGSTTFIRLLG